MLHKLLTRIFLARVLLRTLDEAQPAELDSARDSAACITSISKIIEFFQEYRLRLVFAFIEYDKAFNSIETNERTPFRLRSSTKERAHLT